MSTTMTPYRSSVPVARDSFVHLALAEFTKLRTIRGWIAGLIVGALLIVGIGFLSAAGSRRTCGGPNGPVSGKACGSGIPTLGPNGEAVTDNFYFVRQQLSGDGTITARITSLGEQVQPPNGGDGSSWQPGVVPWAKAGLIVKTNTTQGSPYVAIMATAARRAPAIQLHPRRRRERHDGIEDVSALAAADPLGEHPDRLRGD